MNRSVCYLYGNKEAPSFHGTVSFEFIAQKRVRVQIHLYGVTGAAYYRLQQGAYRYPLMAGDEYGEIHVTFYRHGDWQTLETRISVAYYGAAIIWPEPAGYPVARGTVREMIAGSRDYENCFRKM